MSRPKGTTRGGRKWTSNPPGSVSIRLNVSADVAIAFRALAKSLGTTNADLARRLAEAAANAGPTGTVSIKKVGREIEDAYRQRAVSMTDQKARETKAYDELHQRHQAEDAEDQNRRTA